MASVTTVIVTVVLAFAGYLATYVNGLRLAQRQARLARVSQQLSEFYGPLFALTETNSRTFEAFQRAFARPDGSDPFSPGVTATEEELAQWRAWATAVFVPNTRAMRDVVVRKADLLVEEEVPQVLLRLCAHVAGYEITLGRWAEGDHEESWGLGPYPGRELEDYAREAFVRLKAEQSRLLGRRVSR